MSPFTFDRMQACHADFLDHPAEVTEASCQNIRVKIFPIRTKPRFDHFPLAMDPHKNPKLGQEIEFLNEQGLLLRRYSGGQLSSPQEKIQRVAIRYEQGELLIRTWSPSGEDLKENPPLKFEPFWVLPQADDPTTVTWKGPNSRGTPIDIDMIFRGGFAVRMLPASGPGERPRPGAKDLLTVINHVSLEDYLYATVSSEMRLDFHLEALKAQAVGARTFALRAILTARYDRELARPQITRDIDDWDVLPTTMFQQYLGVGKENPRSIQAVNGTKYVYLAAIDPLWRVRAPIEAMYSDTSGGHTCFPADCMNGSLVRPGHLSPVMDAPGTDQPQYFGRSTAEVSANGVRKILERLQIREARITGLSEVPGSRQSQRIQEFRVETGNGTYINLNRAHSDILASSLGFKTSLLLSQDQLRSKILWRIEFPDDPTQAVAVPVYGGLGHPIGMSQWGAAIFAQSYGYTYTRILNHFYQGAQLLRLNQRL